MQLPYILQRLFLISRRSERREAAKLSGKPTDVPDPERQRAHRRATAARLAEEERQEAAGAAEEPAGEPHDPAEAEDPRDARSRRTETASRS